MERRKKEVTESVSNALQPALDVSKLVAWRHALHRCPELGFELGETAGYIERQLRELGIETHSADRAGRSRGRAA